MPLLDRECQTLRVDFRYEISAPTILLEKHQGAFNKLAEVLGQKSLHNSIVFIYSSIAEQSCFVQIGIVGHLVFGPFTEREPLMILWLHLLE